VNEFDEENILSLAEVKARKVARRHSMLDSVSELKATFAENGTTLNLEIVYSMGDTTIVGAEP
jgi:hypothetical protein